MATTMASPAQIKSILKKYPSQPTSTELTNLPSTPSAPSYSRPDPKTFEDRNREIALYHANLLQQRKDIELTILLATETLIDFPLSPPPQYTSSSPSPSDASQFKTLLQHFTTSDYDALIEERNINEKCGYALCPKRRVKEGGGGEWRLLGMGGKARDFRVVRKQELEMWCQQGNQCKRRALYVRVQLGDTPAWERGAGGLLGSRIDLLDEPKTDQDTVMEGIQSLKLDGERKEMDGRNLAFERGESGMSARSGIVDVKILERDVVRKVEPPSLGEEELRAKLEHLELEGYTSKFGEQRKKLLEMERNGDEMDEDGDEEDTDWKL